MRILFVTLLLAANATAETLNAATPEHARYSIEASFAPGRTIDAVVYVRLPAETANADPAFIIGRRFAVEVETDARASIVIEDVETPIPQASRISISLAEPATAPVETVFRYKGPLNPGDGAGYPIAVTDDHIELRGEMLWYPVFHTFNLSFAFDAAFKGLPADFVAVAPGKTERRGDAFRVHRAVPDIDAPLVAARGLVRRAAPGIEIYAVDFDWIITGMFRRHALASAAYFQQWFGPLPSGDVSVVVLPNPSGSYATRGYIVTGEGRDAAARVSEIPETGPARLIAHEFAHAWWAPVDLLSDNRWLAESMAEFLALRYIEHAFGILKANELLERKRERAEAAAPVIGAGRPSSDSSYMRGPFLLFELEKRIGRAALDEILKRLAGAPPSRTDEFMIALRDVAGQDAVTYFDALMRSGPGAWKEKGDVAASAEN